MLKKLGAEESTIGTVFGHLRYNLFLVIYPIGAYSDLMTGMMAVDYMQEKNIYVWKLPNKYNVSFDFPWFMWYVVSTIYCIMLPFNYYYLVKQR